MNKERRNNLRSVINQCRKILEEEITRRISYYGIKPDGKTVEVSKLDHLTQNDIEIRKRLEQATEKEKLGGLTQEEAVIRYIRHVGFTYLNRFAALRAMEVRGLIKETIIRRDKYHGRSLREMQLAEKKTNLKPDRILKESLIEAFNEVSQEIRVLFDVGDSYSLVFPEARACQEVIRLLSEQVTEDDWKEDDIIGWIYQYYNEEARKEFRESKRKPQPDDIPVINQFYTPHWVVKALVDNTLGKLWLEMRPNSRIKEFCNYLVPTDKNLNRESKKARDIKILDPACGSGHFLVYAFDLLHQIYKEDEPDTLDSEIPSLILEHNLYGIDIDLRAVQLAALSLYLKAKTYNRSLKVRKMNLVCADVRISDGHRREEFLARFMDDPPLQKIFKKIFDDLNSTFEIGSLLKIRKPFEQLFATRKPTGDRQAKFSVQISGQTQLSDKGLVGQSKLLVEGSSDSENSLLMIIPKERTLEEMVEDLRNFEGEALETKDMGSLLFATETEKSIGLLSLLVQEYDVVVMNPPYGDMPVKTKEYLKNHYPKTHFDYYAAFLEQAVNLTKHGGYIGALTGRTFMFLRSYKWIRENLLKIQARPQMVFDLGFGVLDVATARWAAIIANKEKGHENQIIRFFQLTKCSGEEERRGLLETMIKAPNHQYLYQITLKELESVPDMAYSYWASATLRDLFNRFPPLDRDVARKKNKPKIADAKVGLQTGDDSRFVREFWEVPPFVTGSKWVPFSETGGLFYGDVRKVVNWENNGNEIKNNFDEKGKARSRPQNESFYFRDGLRWTYIVNDVRLNACPLPADCVFDLNSPCVFTTSSNDHFPLIAILNSSLAAFMFTLTDPLAHARQAGSMSHLPINPSALKNERLGILSREAYELLREWDTGNETSNIFIKPWLLQVLFGFNATERPVTQHPSARDFEWSDWPSLKLIRKKVGSKGDSIRRLAQICIERRGALIHRLRELQEIIDNEIYKIYQISKDDRLLIERELLMEKEDYVGKKIKSEELGARSETVNEDEYGLEEFVSRLLSHYVKVAIESDQDGIVGLVDIPENPSLIRRIQKLVAEHFGEEYLEKFEEEIREILHISLDEWLAKEYFEFHTTLYKRRPIFWQLTSHRLGKSRGPPGAFSCFVHYHKLTRDTIPKIQGLYLSKVMEQAKREKERLFRELGSAKAAKDKARITRLQAQYEEALNKIEELEVFDAALTKLHNPREDKTVLKNDSKWIDRAIAEVRDNGWRPVIDYGVRVNIEPLKELKVLHATADRVK